MKQKSRGELGNKYNSITSILPLSKNFTKKLLYNLGLWRKGAEIYVDDPFLIDEIYRFFPPKPLMPMK